MRGICSRREAVGDGDCGWERLGVVVNDIVGKESGEREKKEQ